MHNLYKDGAAHAQASSSTSGAVAAVEFIKALFEHTAKPVYICSFPNERDDPKQVGESHIATRLASHVCSFVEKWDKPGRGLFFGVGTVNGDKRNKENIVETIGLHADIDFKNVDLLGDDPRGDVLRHLARLKYIPSATVFSGNGVHAYWLFKEPMPTQGNIERIELALRQLADLVAGDLAVCEVARVLRLPQTHNTKGGAWNEVEVVSLEPARRYELDDLEEWLSEVSPVMLREARARRDAGRARHVPRICKPVRLQAAHRCRAALEGYDIHGVGRQLDP